MNYAGGSIVFQNGTSHLTFVLKFNGESLIDHSDQNLIVGQGYVMLAVLTFQITYFKSN